MVIGISSVNLCQKIQNKTKKGVRGTSPVHKPTEKEGRGQEESGQFLQPPALDTVALLGKDVLAVHSSRGEGELV